MVTVAAAAQLAIKRTERVVVVGEYPIIELCIRVAMRRAWILAWINRRAEFGFYGHLMTELEAESEADFKNLLRMEPAMFRELLEMVALSKTQTTERHWNMGSP